MTGTGRARWVVLFVVAMLVGTVIAMSLNQAAFTTQTVTGAVIYALTVGAVYAIAASGLVVTYATSGIFNFAQGAIGMVMAFLYWELRVDQGWPAWLALIAVVLVIAPMFGALIERTLMRRIAQAQLVVQLVVTIGLMFLLMGVAATVWDENSMTPLPEFFADKHGIDIGNVVLTWHRFVTIGVAILIAVFLRLLLYRSRTGVAMRAVVDNRELAALNGVRPGRVSGLAWALGCSMAAIAGILLAPNVGMRVDVLTLFIVDAFAAAIIGRLHSLPWTFVGGLIIGVVQSFALNFLQLGGRWGTLSVAIPAIILFVALLVVPAAHIELGRRVSTVRPPKLPSMRRSVVGMAALVGIALLVAQLGGLDTTNVRRLTLALITALIMLSLVPLTGWAGQVSLAQITFVGVGALVMAEVAGDAGSWLGAGNPLGLFVAAAAAVPFGVLMALPALRLQGLYLALASMAFAVMAIPLFFAQPELFGAEGRKLTPPRFLGIDFGAAHNFLVLAAVAFALVGLFVVWLRRGRYGRRLLALRDSPAACATVGIDLVRTKLLVFALAAAMAGFAGGLLGMYRGTVGTLDFQMLVGIPFLLLLVVGGVGTVSGALIGGLSSVMLIIVQDEVSAVVFGVSVFVALTRIGPGLAAFGASRSPEGVVGDLGTRRWRRSRRGGSHSAGAPAALAAGGPTIDLVDGTNAPVHDPVPELAKETQ